MTSDFLSAQRSIHQIPRSDGRLLTDFLQKRLQAHCGSSDARIQRLNLSAGMAPLRVTFTQSLERIPGW